MAENPRELIRTAQSAELRGDVSLAVEYLQRAAAAYREAGNLARALQLLRHARRLDASRQDLLEEVGRLEGLSESGGAEPELRLSPPAAKSVGPELVVPPSPEREVRGSPVDEARRQRLVAETLQAVEHPAVEKSAEVAAWVLDEEVSEDLQRLEVQLARVAAAVDPTGVTAPASMEQAASASREASAEEAPPRRRREARIIERGPTRADVSLDAWCSFCCRPRAEVGDLVAGPAGAFICKACLTESSSLLADVSPVPLPVRARAAPRTSTERDFVGQPELRTQLEAALQSGVRCVLLVGGEGCGKSTLLRMFQRQGRGVMANVDSLAEDVSSTPLFIEDVERLGTERWAALATFLTRASRPTVVLSARGQSADAGTLALRGGSARLFVPTTEVLSRAVRGLLPVSVLEHVQVLVSLRQPSRADYVEMARATLARREPATSLSDDALAVFAAEAERSPRAGHELNALLNRVPSGTWELEPVTKPPSTRKGRRKGTS
ncbi:TPR repeat-containing ClpX C4-type zinc finger protein [Myxococcus stipitatus DSM 14675]|uniref:TPR repeat-containing ClpX C4-type zinc finger protein n=1 Tax=Myxococcus stipitatus (strain DSM 14675 / JCM 12634 / Mx s8) TaxID=1278073 RepID=L7UB09_MYXSD|nr:ClpX C4-type zinc finger protein [Myxococcus stipitatus]AGC45040.1 TPR repeat-containing ClpX C4-type zinc finger protein [Myxococcus stipitatus DSM 14675]